MANTPDTNPTDLGMNRTGIQTAPLQIAKMLENSGAVSQAAYDPAILLIPRSEVASAAPPLGTMPVPATLKGMAKTAMQALAGDKSTVFLDKLAQRLAFERTGVRLYEAVMAKIPAAENGAGTLTLQAMQQIHDDELDHFRLVKEAIEHLGGDPTAQTPSADLVGVQGMGFVQSVTDSRTTLSQCLDTLLAAELIDNDCWATLISMADALRQGELAERFREALAEEDRHLVQVRSWIAERVGTELGEPLRNARHEAHAAI